VPALKQQQDTIATLAELARIGVPAAKIRLVFNLVEDGTDVRESFEALLSFIKEHPMTQASTQCRLGTNEIYQRLKATNSNLCELANDTTDYKAQIAKTAEISEKLALAQRLATCRLAAGVLPELDDCFAALELG
jgi:hypothetical protein